MTDRKGQKDKKKGRTRGQYVCRAGWRAPPQAPPCRRLCACAGWSAAAGQIPGAGGAQPGECLTWQFSAQLQLRERNQPVGTPARGEARQEKRPLRDLGHRGQPALGAERRLSEARRRAAADQVMPRPAQLRSGGTLPRHSWSGCGARTRVRGGQRLDAHLWQGSGGDLLLCSFSPFVQFNNWGWGGWAWAFFTRPHLCVWGCWN